MTSLGVSDRACWGRLIEQARGQAARPTRFAGPLYRAAKQADKTPIPEGYVFVGSIFDNLVKRAKLFPSLPPADREGAAALLLDLAVECAAVLGLPPTPPETPPPAAAAAEVPAYERPAPEPRKVIFG